MKFTFHLNNKNGYAGIAGICVVVLAYIPLAVPADHWSWMRWKSAVIGCGLLAGISLFLQALAQSKEDAEREEREKQRDSLLDGLRKNVPEQSRQSTTLSNALTRGMPHVPGTFDSAEFFRIAYHSPLQDVSANSFKAEAERVRPGNKESFYLDVLAVGSMAAYYDGIWWPLYRSQLRALLRLNGENGIVSVDIFRHSYDEAAKEFAKEYAEANIQFDNWMEYLSKNTLLKIHPSKMVEITVMGKDFLKYLLHCGRSEATKRL